MKLTNNALVALPLLLLLAACGDTPPPKAAAPAEAAPPPPGPSTAEEELEAPEVAYAYSSVGKRDPFRSFFFDALDTKESGQTELQKYQLDQLKLVAIVTGRAAPYAMVEDPTGKGHTLTRGTLIGKNWGHVATINPDCLSVKEEYRDYTGRKVTNEVPICLPKKNELKLDN